MAEQTIMVPAASTGAVLRQFGLLAGIAASVALGMWVVLWSRTPDYSLLYGDLSERDVADVVQTLETGGIPYRLDPATGGVMVGADRVHDARLKLAAAGLPRSGAIGFEMLEEQQSFATSKFIEGARYQRALEGELGRTIAQMTGVRGVRVHLAIPKDTVFMRDRPGSSASVLLDLYGGRNLDDGQIAAIVHLVSSSVPGLAPDAVTVVDQAGRLLTSRYESAELAVTAKRFEYTSTLERSYAERIEEILSPLVGAEGVKAQVTAELDFTAIEQASERYNPDLPVVRSEQTLEESRTGAGPGGIPGALSNQPPGEASAPEVAGATQASGPGVEAAPGAQEAAAGAPGNSRKTATRNYEIDKTVSYTRMPVGSVRRLSAAVVVNNKPVVDAEGKVTWQALEQAEIDRITSLVKEAIGFSAARGDTVNVINAEFKAPEAIETLPQPPLWEQPWLLSLGKQALGGLFALILAFGVIRPVMRNLMKRDPVPAPMLAAATAGALPGPGGTMALPAGAGGPGADAQPQGLSQRQLSSAALMSGDVDTVRSFVTQDPKVAAQVVKSWVSQD